MPLYIGTPSVFVHTEQRNLFGHILIEHTLWSTVVLVLSSTILGGSCPKADSYMVSELLETSSTQSR